jgi:Domain of unknown function (DUF5664)
VKKLNLEEVNALTVAGKLAYDRDGDSWGRCSEARYSSYGLGPRSFQAYGPWTDAPPAEVKSEAVPDPLPLPTIESKATEKKKKPRFSLLPMDALYAVAEVLTFGAVKYADDSWKRAPFTKADYLDAMGRHWAKIAAGELRDAETGYLHAAHLACNAIFYLWHQMKETP